MKVEVTIMANYGGFYKGDKKKPKKERLETMAKKAENAPSWGNPAFTPPVILPKGKQKE